MKKRAGLLLSAMAVTPLLLSASPATAATRTVGDPRGDASATYDFTRLTYGNGATVSGRAKVVDLRQVRSAFLVKMYRPGHPNATYQALTKLRKDGSVTSTLHYYDADEFKRVRCDVEGTWQPGRNVVKVSFPHSCLKWHGTLRMYAFLGRPASSGELDHVDTTTITRVPFG